jgi:hypothetical protein
VERADQKMSYSEENLKRTLITMLEFADGAGNWMQMKGVYDYLQIDYSEGEEISKELSLRKCIKLTPTFGDFGYLGLVQLLDEGIEEAKRLKEMKGGIPEFYLTRLKGMSKKQLLEFKEELQQKRATHDIGSRTDTLVLAKIEQIDDYLYRKKGKISWAWNIITFFIGLGLGIIGILLSR